MRTSPTGLSKNNSLPGFTLIELLIVLFIVGLFSALLSIRIEGALSGGDLRLATRVVIGEIKKLRGKAAYSHQDHEMVFHIDENRFYPVEPASEEGESSQYSMAENSTEPDEVSLPDGVSLEGVVIASKGKSQEGEAAIRFYGNGCIDRSLIHLRNEKNEAYTLEINPLTGRVKIYDRYVDQRVAD